MLRLDIPKGIDNNKILVNSSTCEVRPGRSSHAALHGEGGPCGGDGGEHHAAMSAMSSPSFSLLPVNQSWRALRSDPGGPTDIMPCDSIERKSPSCMNSALIMHRAQMPSLMAPLPSTLPIHIKRWCVRYGAVGGEFKASEEPGVAVLTCRKSSSAQMCCSSLRKMRIATILPLFWESGHAIDPPCRSFYKGGQL